MLTRPSGPRRYTLPQARRRRYWAQRLEVGIASGATFLAALGWGGLLSVSHLGQWPTAPLLTWITLPVLLGAGAGAWAVALYWSSGWDEVWGAGLTEARLSLSQDGQSRLDAWARDGRALLVRDVRWLRQAERRATSAARDG